MKQAGQIVLFDYPHTELNQYSLHPALLIAKLPGNYDDWLILMISSNLNQYQEGIDDMITEKSSDYLTSGLKSNSIFRVTRIAVVNGDLLKGTIGEISEKRLERIKQNLIKWIQNS